MGTDERWHKHQMHKCKTAELADYYIKEMYSSKIQVTGKRVLGMALVFFFFKCWSWSFWFRLSASFLWVLAEWGCSTADTGVPFAAQGPGDARFGSGPQFPLSQPLPPPTPQLLTEASSGCHNVYKRTSPRHWFPLFLECFWQIPPVFRVSWESKHTFSLFQTRLQSVHYTARFLPLSPSQPCPRPYHPRARGDSRAWDLADPAFCNFECRIWFRVRTIQTAICRRKTEGPRVAKWELPRSPEPAIRLHIAAPLFRRTLFRKLFIAMHPSNRWGEERVEQSPSGV